MATCAGKINSAPASRGPFTALLRICPHTPAVSSRAAPAFRQNVRAFSVFTAHDKFSHLAERVTRETDNFVPPHYAALQKIAHAAKKYDRIEPVLGKMNKAKKSAIDTVKDAWTTVTGGPSLMDREKQRDVFLGQREALMRPDLWSFGAFMGYQK